MDENTRNIVASNLVTAVIIILENHNYDSNFNPLKDDIREIKNETITSVISNVDYVYNKIKNWHQSEK